jgi:hypothetical protein
MSVSSTAPLLSLLDEPVLRSVPEGMGPYPGDIIAWPDRPATKVAAKTASSGDLWRAEGEHVATILDVLRTRDGHEVVVPHCTRLVLDLADARAAGGQAMRPGEIVTLGVSVLRGTVAEAEAHGIPLCRGDWWLDEDGAPQFVHDAAGATAEQAAVRVVHALAAVCEPDAATTALLDRAARAFADPDRLVTAAASVEADLFGLAEAEAIGTQILARRGRLAPDSSRAAAPADRPAWQRLADAADAGVAEMISQALTGVWSAVRHRRRAAPGRPRPGRVLVAAACGALVLAAGLLWPAGDEGDPTPRAPSGDVVTSSTPSAPSADRPSGEEDVVRTTSGDDPAGAAGDADVVEAVGRLLDAARACGGKTECVRPLLDEDAALLKEENEARWEGAAFANGSSRQLTLLDDVGGLVLVRADDTTGVLPSQVVAAVRGEEEWVLRDIHDVAQHPG